MKNKNYCILLMCFLGFYSISAQINCEDWIPPQCEQEVINFAQNVLEETDCKQWLGRCDYNSTIYRPGAVSIGTDQPSSFALTVTEGIAAKAFRICLTPGSWCDYVFEDDYNLYSLEEVKGFINENGHLHKTTSAKEINEQGSIDMGGVALDHQEKIEEIFLHLIEMKKKAAHLQEELALLVEENQKLKKEYK